MQDVRNESKLLLGATKVEIIEAGPDQQRFRTPVQRTGYNLWKRGLDLSLGLVALILLSPIMIIAAAMIYFTDRGPVLYKSYRVGRGGKPFLIYKFRTMCIDADKKLDEIKHLNEHDDVIFKAKNDPRITKVGKVLRRFSIDEMPQFINVVQGKMSMVGPRPMLQHEVEKYNIDYFRRLHIKPGITCYWQVMGRSNLTFEQWMELDLKYVEEMGFWTDIKILLKTPKAVLMSDGAY